MATCLAETILETAALSGFSKLSEQQKLQVMLQSIYEASGSADDLDTLMLAANTAGFAKIADQRYKACILLQLLVNINAGTTAASTILSDAATSQFMFLAENDKKTAFLQLMCDYNAVDADAALFISTAGITDATEQAAIIALVEELKTTAPLWDNGVALYPIVGGTQAKFAYNLVDPTAYEINWVNTLVVSDQGVKSNGTDSYGRTGITKAVTTNNYSLSCYKVEVASGPGGFPQVISAYLGPANSPRELGHNSATQLLCRTPDTLAQNIGGSNQTGTVLMTCTEGGQFRVFVRGVEGSSSPVAQAGNMTADPTAEYGILNRFTTSPSSLWYTGFIGFFAFWSADVSAYTSEWNTAMENFQTALGRNA